ncbi:SDR family NAD(P)-dependent oxidoreductase [Dactylosporangium darangshiense]|uniref:Uncharacterized protein n=1 Tax=Dactylosporangium darangshiense TaxID=579108 RepID=A0ABP8D0Y1_9ACTN
MPDLAVVTGAAGGIGAAVAARLAADGFTVCGLDRADGDLTTEAGVAAAFASAAARFAGAAGRSAGMAGGFAGIAGGSAGMAGGSVDMAGGSVGMAGGSAGMAGGSVGTAGVHVLVHCAGVTAGAPAHETSLADWRAVLDANLTSAFLCARAVLPGMMAAGRGVIVTIGSIHARAFGPGLPAYAAAKAGLAAFTRQLAVDYGRFGIRAVTVSPGWVRTADTATRLTDPDDLARLAETQRLGEPDDVAAAVSFAVSDAAALLTGTEIVLDGGATAFQTAALLRPGPRRRLGLPVLHAAQTDCGSSGVADGSGVGGGESAQAGCGSSGVGGESGAGGGTPTQGGCASSGVGGGSGAGREEAAQAGCGAAAGGCGAGAEGGGRGQGACENEEPGDIREE